MSKFEDNPTWVVMMWLVLAIASLNWALVAQFDINLVVEIFGDSAYYVYMAIGGIALIDLLETFGFIDVMD